VPDLALEHVLMNSTHSSLIGVDEVGRGALAGPVTVGGVRISMATGDAPLGIDDSKRLSSRRRSDLVPRIVNWADAWSIVHIPAIVIDRIGIMGALALGAREVCRDLMDTESGWILLDGDRDFISPYLNSTSSAKWHVATQVKADASCLSVAAASVLAKVARDSLMIAAHDKAPMYGWQGNKGYGAATHRAAIVQYGSTHWHRRSWRLLPE
jgi:ribonuclease HII